MDNFAVVNATKSRIENGYMALPKRFAAQWLPPARDDLNVFVGRRPTPSILPFVPASDSAKEARIYGLTEWYDTENVEPGDKLLIVALDRERKIYHAGRYDQDLEGIEISDTAATFDEGRSIVVVHLSKERNRTVVSAKKRAVITEHGKLECEVCSFDFSEEYGALGHGFAECHHILPLSKIEGETKTTLSDLAIVCANCHRMLHRKPHPTIEELRYVVQARRNPAE